MILNSVVVLITFIGIHIYYFHGELVFHLERIFDQNDLVNNSTFDYIVVGSGTAGSIVAQGLQNASVLLVEAGGFGSIFFDVPVLLPLLQKTSYDWKYVTTPQKHACLALKNRQSLWPMGKIVGGTHKLNNLIYHEGHPSDYEDLIDLGRNQYQEIPVEETVIKTKFADAFVEAGQELGFDDFWYTNLTLSHGKRITFGHQLRESRKRKITKFSQVTRILFDDRKRAVGVEIHKGNSFYQINARKGVILSAGVIGTPKILMLSGIGPKEDLEKLKIPVIADLPVGKNLQDHIVTGMNLILLNQSLGVDILNVLHPKETFNYFSSSGPSKFSFGGCDAMGFVSLNPLKSNVPDLSFMVIPNGLASDYGLIFRQSVNLNDSVWEKYFQPLIDKHSMTILPVLLHPKSRGSVKLQSNDFRDLPIINPNYLEHPDDVRKLIAGIRIIQSLLSTKAMESLEAELNPKPLPGCDDIQFNSDQYWECYIRHLTLSMFHPAGTCSMGNPADDTTVVLKDFSVKNIRNLFIVDGSVLPNTPSGNPNGVIAMFARKFLEIVNK